MASRLKSSWYLWVFPVIALVIVISLFTTFFRVRGPVIQIAFDDASVIKPEKTTVRYRGVTIGVVKEVKISEDGKDALVNVQLQRDAKNFAVEGTKFWVVVPKVNLEGVSGLATLFEGSYIAAQPGDANGPEKLAFNGREGSQAVDPLDETSSYILETDQLGSVGVDDAVTFRGLKIGSVTKLTLSKTAQTVMVQINVQNRYVRLIRANSYFWRKVGIQAKLGLFNSELKVNSLDSVLHCGIDLFTPSFVGEVAKALTKFTLHPAPPKDIEKWNPVLEMQ